jgi:hypothetical protein
VKIVNAAMQLLNKGIIIVSKIWKISIIQTEADEKASQLTDGSNGFPSETPESAG